MCRTAVYGASVKDRELADPSTYDSAHKFRALADPAMLHFEGHKLYEELRASRIGYHGPLNFLAFVQPYSALSQGHRIRENEAARRGIGIYQ